MHIPHYMPSLIKNDKQNFAYPFYYYLMIINIVIRPPSVITASS